MKSVLGVAALSLGVVTHASCNEPRNTSSPSQGLQIFLDFDGTIVTSDAYTTLAYAAYDSLPANSSVTSWDEIEATYEKVYDAVDATIKEPTSLSEAISYANNQALRGVEQWSFLWVQDLGIFNTAKKSELVKFARNQTLRTGWCDFARTAQENGDHINVISLSWSPSWIRLVLQEAADCPDVTENISTYCAQILPEGVLPALELNHDAQLFSGGDKTELIKKMVAGVPVEQARHVVFVSDADADLQPLWEAPTNIGVVAGLANSGAKTFEQYGVKIANASQGWQGHTGEKGFNNSFVYGFEDWRDVKSLLWG